MRDVRERGTDWDWEESWIYLWRYPTPTRITTPTTSKLQNCPREVIVIDTDTSSTHAVYILRVLASVPCKNGVLLCSHTVLRNVSSHQLIACARIRIEAKTAWGLTYFEDVRQSALIMRQTTKAHNSLLIHYHTIIYRITDHSLPISTVFSLQSSATCPSIISNSHNNFVSAWYFF